MQTTVTKYVFKHYNLNCICNFFEYRILSMAVASMMKRMITEMSIQMMISMRITLITHQRMTILCWPCCLPKANFVMRLREG